MCNECKNQINENEEFEAISNELKRDPLDEFGHMPP